MTDTAAQLPALSKVQRSFHAQVVFGTSFIFLTSGVFLSGLAIYMGASDLLVSYISMITNICGISIIFFSSFMERFRSFKKITIGLTVLSKFATLLIVLIPVFVPADMQIIIFIPVMITAFTLQAQTTVVLNNWMVTFVEEKKSGRYIAGRQTFVLGVTVILSLAGGRLLDAVSGAYIGFFLLFLAAMIMGVLEIIVLLRIPDVEQQKIMVKKSRFSDMVRVPFRNRQFLAFVVYIFLFYLMLSIADSFTVVYMMRYLQLSYVTTTGRLTFYSLSVLYIIHEKEGNCTQKMICDQLLLPKQTINTILNSFEKKEWIIRSTMENDKRNKAVLFTVQGQDFADRIMKELYQLEACAMNKMKEGQRADMADNNRLFLTNLHKVMEINADDAKEGAGC